MPCADCLFVFGLGFSPRGDCVLCAASRPRTRGRSAFASTLALLKLLDDLERAQFTQWCDFAGRVSPRRLPASSP